MLSTSIWLVVFSATGAITQEAPDFAKRLSAHELQARMKAVTDLEQAAAAVPTVIAEQPLQKAIPTLLESENARVTANLASLPATGHAQLDEGYGEYYSQVFGLANRVRADDRLSSAALTSRLRRPLIFGTYNPDSDFVADIAREGDAIVPLVLELSRRGWPEQTERERADRAAVRELERWHAGGSLVRLIGGGAACGGTSSALGSCSRREEMGGARRDARRRQGSAPATRAARQERSRRRRSFAGDRGHATPGLTRMAQVAINS